MGCCSARDQLCDRCLGDELAHLRGVAACRGEFWATSVEARVGNRGPWPAFEDPRCRSIAYRKIVDLGRDARLRDELARIVHEWAARRWNR